MKPAVWLMLCLVAMGLRTPTPVIRQVYGDPLGNAYTLSSDGSLTKLGTNGQVLFVQNIRSLGELTFLDAGNPLETYLFFNASGKVVFLDNTLSVRGSLDLNDAGMPWVQAACRSYDNQLWVFDPADQQLKHVQRNLEVMHQSGNVQAFASGQFQVNAIIDNGVWVYLLTDEGRLIQFDQTANFQKIMPVNGVKWAASRDEKWVYWKGDSIYEGDATLRLNKAVARVPEKTKQLALSGIRVMGLVGDSVVVVR